VRLEGSRLVNDGDRAAIAKVTCSRREFDGEYDRFYVLGPGGEARVPHRAGSVCAVESVDLRTPEELRLEVRP
jgi:hypothetical protein